ncbi:MAG: class I SAM-dependent methyltransferase [Pseudomonadota bacterium]
MEKWVEEVIITLLDPRPGERILDIGCGSGNQLLFLNKMGLDPSGVDASPYMIARARERLGDRCTLKTGRAEDLPYDDNEFDLAIMINTLEFLDDPLEALKEAARVARRRVFIGVINSLSWTCQAAKVKGLFRESIFSHLRAYNLWELKSLVKGSFGNAPTAWQCGQLRPAFMKKEGDPLAADQWNVPLCPAGAFLGLSITLTYWVRTEGHPLKIRLKKAGQTVVNGVTMKDIKPMKEARKNERSLFV